MHPAIVRVGGLALALILLAACAVPQPSINEAKQFDTPPQLKAKAAAAPVETPAVEAPPESDAEAAVMDEAPTEAPVPTP